MHLKRTGNGIHAVAPAKVNLFLEVLGKRDDGFHEVETVLCPISLCDEVHVRPVPTPEVTLDLTLPAARAQTIPDLDGQRIEDQAWQIPSGSSNLVVRALQELRQQLGLQDGFHVELLKRIPAAAGLGGGSSDAAAAVVAGMLAHRVWDRGLAVDICARLGSDIPFFLGQVEGCGIALATGRGEQCRHVDAIPELRFVLTHAPLGCATQAVYGCFAEQRLRKKQAVFRQSSRILDACQTGQWQKIGAALFNTLQFSAASLNPWIELQLSSLADSGAEYALMSGSGSSCFALAGDPITQQTMQSQLATGELPRVYAVEAIYAAGIESQISGWDLR